MSDSLQSRSSRSLSTRTKSELSPDSAAIKRSSPIPSMVTAASKAKPASKVTAASKVKADTAVVPALPGEFKAADPRGLGAFAAGKSGALPSLPSAFFARPTLEVAPELLGKTLVRRLSDGRLAAHEIIEVEAYTQDDPACHAFRGPTKRSAILFGPPGVAYVYFIYGMYHCLNAVTELDGVAGAVLIRGLRGENLGGPGKLCRELDIDLAHNGLPLFESTSEIYFAPGRDLSKSEFETTPRIGISKAKDRLWRYIVKEENSGRNKRRR